MFAHEEGVDTETSFLTADLSGVLSSKVWAWVQEARLHWRKTIEVVLDKDALDVC